MTELFRCRDRRGRDVMLPSRIWIDHILCDHPELDGLVDSLEVTIIDPYRIFRDTTIRERLCYYRQGVLPASFPFYLKVVVEYQQVRPSMLWIGTVITAYPTDRFKSKEKQVWP